MTDIREIALRVIAGKAQEGDALAMAEYIERNEVAFKQQESKRLNAVNEILNGQYLLVEGVKIPLVFSEDILQADKSDKTHPMDIFFSRPGDEDDN